MTQKSNSQSSPQSLKLFPPVLDLKTTLNVVELSIDQHFKHLMEQELVSDADGLTYKGLETELRSLKTRNELGKYGKLTSSHGGIETREELERILKLEEMRKAQEAEEESLQQMLSRVKIATVRHRKLKAKKELVILQEKFNHVSHIHPSVLLSSDKAKFTKSETFLKASKRLIDAQKTKRTVTMERLGKEKEVVEQAIKSLTENLAARSMDGQKSGRKATALIKDVENVIHQYRTNQAKVFKAVDEFDSMKALFRHLQTYVST